MSGYGGYVDNLVYDDVDALADAAAHHIATVLEDAIRDRDTASLCVAGGATPRAAYQRLASTHATTVDWSRVEVWFGDERCVPSADRQSNYLMVDEALIGRVGIPSTNVHRIAGELDPAEAARAYDVALHAAFPEVLGEPSFDLLLLGIGTDGHVASLFPDGPALLEVARWAMAVEPPQLEPRVARVTLTPPILQRARRVLYLVSGEPKRAIARRVLLGSEALPAALVRGREQTLWLMDMGASPGR